jgi:flagellar protein FlaJ
MVLDLLPLLAVLFVVGVFALSAFSRRIDRGVTRLAYLLFRGDEVTDGRRRQALRAGGIGTPYRIYVTTTHLYTAVGAIVGSVLGVYAATAVLTFLSVNELGTLPILDTLSSLPRTLRTDVIKRFAVYLASSLLLGGLSAAVVYTVRWQLPSMRADTRRRQIDASMPRMVAFIYALSRGGMAFPDVMRALARNRGVFGAGAEEMDVGVRDIDLFGADVVTTIRRVSQRTPSQQFQRFAENLTNVLQSGQDLSAFLHEQYERYREQAEEQQEEILELLATTAEVYVTVVVAGMLFLLTILLVIGLTSGGTLVLLELLTYLVLPATNLLFVGYLAEVTQPLRASRDREGTDDRHEARVVGGPTGARADGGYSDERSLANLERLRAYRRFRRARRSLESPFDALLAEPSLVLAVTVPLALAFVGLRLPAVFEGGFDLRMFDDVLVVSTLFVLSTFAVVYELGQRRLSRLEESVPDLLDRLAGLNEAGVSIISSFDRVRRMEIGNLDDEVDHVWRDIQWGATVEQALHRFETRVRTPAVTRTVTLITNAMAASNEIGPVLRIAAEQARSDRRLKRQRRQEMFTYLVVVYVAFVVFLVVIVSIDTVLIPSLPTADEATAASGAAQSAGASALGFIGITQAQIESYRLVFFHAALIQAVLSGLVAGQMANATIKGGVKHASVMLFVTYLVFLFL